MAKKAPKTNTKSKRTISTIKKQNHARNKLNKRKTNSNNQNGSKFSSHKLSNPGKKKSISKQSQGTSETMNKKKQHADLKSLNDDPDPVSEDEENLMSVDDASFLARAFNLSQSDDTSLIAHEKSAIHYHRRLADNSDNYKMLLPTKDKHGHLVVQKVINKDVDEDSEVEESGDNDSSGESDEDELAENKKSRIVNQSTGVLEKLAIGRQGLNEFKIKVGFMASTFIEEPEAKMHLLKKLNDMSVEMVETEDSSTFPNFLICYKYLTSTLVEIFKDVLPNYKIKKYDANNDNVLKKKDVMKILGYESELLGCLKSFLVSSEDILKRRKLDLMLVTHVIRCLSDLWSSHPMSDYGPNMAKLLIPYLNLSSSSTIRDVVKDAVKTVLSNDLRGDLSSFVVLQVKNFIKAKKFNCHPDILISLLPLKLSYAESGKTNRDDERRLNNKNEKQSKKEKKHAKQMKQLERQLREAKGEEAVETRRKSFTTCAHNLFHILFQVVKGVVEFDQVSLITELDGERQRKHYPKSVIRLYHPSLKCINQFCPYINIDFFHDLLTVMAKFHLNKECLQTYSSKKYREQVAFYHLISIHSYFNILCGPGTSLLHDTSLTTQRFMHLIDSQLLSHTTFEGVDVSKIICEIFESVTIKRRRICSSDLARCVINKLCSLVSTNFQLLQKSRTTVDAKPHDEMISLECEEDCMRYLECLTRVKSAHALVFADMLTSMTMTQSDDEHKVGKSLADRESDYVVRFIPGISQTNNHHHHKSKSSSFDNNLKKLKLLLNVSPFTSIVCKLFKSINKIQG